MIKFQDLINSSGVGEAKSDREVNHICCDSRLAGPYSVFVCIEGVITDGHLYAGTAYKAGCRCFVVEHDINVPAGCDIVYTDNSRLALARLSSLLYNNPSNEIKVIGVTGTKGKTTVSLMISGILNKLGIPTGYIGSNGVMYGKFRHMTANTTPESCEIQSYLRDMADNGMKYAVIEVSSQALYMGRVRYVNFDTCIFTNLYTDHIGPHEHPSFEHYRDCKQSLFSQYNIDKVFVNADDSYSEYMIQNCSADVQTFGIDKSCQNTADSISMYKTENSLGMMFDYCCSQGKFPLSIKFPGRFSVSNALAAITACKTITDDISAITEALSQISVEGRFEVVQALPYATIVIDYAHNGASMRSVLETIRMYSPRKIITLFGSVGGRTFMRRAELGKVASQLSDYCILTADNPDCEDPRNIIYDIAKSFDPDGCRYYAIPDREKAIVHAMSLLEPGDVLLLAGKGHENYQLVRGRRVPFCERQIVLDAAEAIQKNKV